MSKRLHILLIALLFLIAACGSETVEPELESETAVSTDEQTEEEPTEEPEPTKEPEPTAEPEPTEEPEPEPTEEPITEDPTTNLTEGCITDYQENVDYFPDKASTIYTSGFTIEYFNNYKVVTVPVPFAGAEAAETYVLVQCGTPTPEGFEDASIIEVPVNRMISMSTTYLPHLVNLGLVDNLIAVDNAGFITSEEIRAKFDSGELGEIGSGPEINVEVALELEPDLVMTFASGFDDFDSHPVLREAGIPVAINADFLDTNPLGQAEWGKFIALFFNEETAVETWFAAVEGAYNTLATTVAISDIERPTVFSQTPFDGTWYAPGGASYTAELFANAGAAYVFADDESTGSLFLDFESVFETAAEADYWLDIGFFGTLADLSAADERYAEFLAFQKGNVFNYDLRTNEFGGNDFFESGSANPHLILADLVKIFHPELVPDHEFVYYRIVE